MNSPVPVAREFEAALFALFEDTDIAIGWFDADGRAREITPALSRLLQLPPTEIGVLLAELLVPLKQRLV